MTSAVREVSASSRLGGRDVLGLLAISFLALFQELALIRWMPGQVRVLAYFPNLILISAFLGLGLGCLRSGRGSLFWLWPVSLVILVAATAAMSGIAFTQNDPSQHLWLLYFDLPQDALVVGDVRPPIIAAFVLATLSFVAPGQILAERLQRFRDCQQALIGYSLDITGSLLGVVGFALASFLETFPVLWFAVIVVVAAPFFLTAGRGLVVTSLCAAVVMLVLVSGAERAERYSPYYALSHRSNAKSEISLLTNGSLHQYAVPVRRDDILATDWQRRVRDGYHIPYDLLPGVPRRVLVVGAGMGNDVAVALERGVEQIDAVEIDPAILEMGRRMHPNRPYDSDRVRVFATDARSFLNDTDTLYDLIVFGTLDSMTRLSALSNVRLDNFVYTLESIRAARDHLRQGGGLVMYFAAQTPYIDDRLEGLLAATFGGLPVVVKHHYEVFNRIYMAGRPFERVRQSPEKARARLEELQQTVRLPHDDWPYLYLRERGISSFYLVLMSVFGLIAILSVSLASRDMRRSLTARRGVDVEMFCFGAAFLLLETKSVTQINLVWGATWLTSAVVFGSILAMILLATLLMRVRPLPWWMAMGGLCVALLANYATPVNVLLSTGVPLRLLLSLLFVGVPIFFAAACFAIVYSEREQVDLAFGWNLLGAVAGGLLEFISMLVGFKALTLVALLAYLVAVRVRLRSSSMTTDTGAVASR